MDKLIEQFEHLKMTAASKDVNEDPSIKDLIETYSKVSDTEHRNIQWCR